MRQEHQPAARATIGLSLPLLAVVLAAPAALSAQTVEKTVKVAPNLYQLEVDPASNTLYVASVGARNQNAQQIVLLDATTLDRKGSIPLEAAAYGLGLNAKTQMLYGTDTRAGNVMAIDLKTNKVVASIGESDGAHLREVRIDEAANRIYVSSVGGRGDSQSEVWVIDGATNALLRRMPLEANSLTGIALDTQGKRIFATAMGSNEIVVINSDTGAQLARWPAGGERPTNAAYEPTTDRLFVSNQGTGTLTVLNAKDGSLIKSVETGAGALDVKLDTDDNRVYVTNRGAGTLSIIDTKSYEVVKHLATGTFAQTVAVDTAADRVWVSNKAQGLGRNAAPDAVPPEDPRGDTVALIRP